MGERTSLKRISPGRGNSKCKGPTVCLAPCPHPLSSSLIHSCSLPISLALVKAPWPQAWHPLPFSLPGPLSANIPEHAKLAQAAFNPRCYRSDCYPHLFPLSLTPSSPLSTPTCTQRVALSFFLVSLTFLLRCTCHTIQFTHFMCTDHQFLVYSQLCNYRHDLNLHFHHPKKKCSTR